MKHLSTQATFPARTNRRRHQAILAGSFAATAALNATGAYAQSSVNLYGVVDAGVGQVRNGNTRSTQQLSGVSAGSRVGFRGQEDLGGGLAANYVLEMGYAADTGNLTQGGLSFGRQASVGIFSTNGWSLSLGRQLSPVALSMIAADPLGWQYFGNTLGTGIGYQESPGETPASGGWQATARVNNSVYGTFKTGALSFAGMVAAGDEDNRGSGHLYSASATYADGPVMLTGAFARFRQYAGAITSTADPDWQAQWLVGGSYDFKVAKLSAGYFSFKPSNGGRTTGIASALDPRFDRSSTGWIGVKIPIGSGVLLANLMRARYKYSTIADSRSTSVGVAYEYYLSKRTALYGSYGQVNNSPTGLMPLFAAIPFIAPSAPGANIRAYGVGIRHVF